MSISLNFELSDRDLEQLHKAMDKAKAGAKDKTPKEVIDCAAQLLVDAQKVEIPEFILQRLLRLDDMIAMIRDEAWALPQEDCDRVLSAMKYFCDPDDVIPDHVEVFGFLDDAVMIELSVGELKHELAAYDDFCDYRQRQAERRGLQPAEVGRADWLESRREELVDRMHVHREREMGQGYGSSSGYASSGRQSYVRTWRPGIFKLR